MAQHYRIHPDNPPMRLIRQAAELLRQGGVLVYPTDSCYALGCGMGERPAELRIRQARGVGPEHELTMVCRDLSEIALYAKVDNAAFRLMKSLTPGPYTFILKATPEVPRRLQNPKRRTIGLRIPAQRVVQLLLGQLDAPLMSTTLRLRGAALPIAEGEEAYERLHKQVDAVLDAGSCGLEPTTVIDLVEAIPRVIRRGRGEVGALAAA
ncbi:MAG: L-threonylcarbamoyladenylate synthase [Gammaproteobacteria bacterium]